MIPIKILTKAVGILLLSLGAFFMFDGIKTFGLSVGLIKPLIYAILSIIGGLILQRI
ncbi:MAG: hypothetical protein KKB88_02220 [Nanoarchaeota archaeon]|nr:hypothetical protein [Nanoarchaeota archaeon]